MQKAEKDGRALAGCAPAVAVASAWTKPGKKGNAAATKVSTVDERQLSLSVTGMSCAACVASVERVLSNVDGVAAVSVNLPLEKAIITLDAATTDQDRTACMAAVERAGFGASELVPALEARRTSEEDVAVQRQKVGLAFALAVPVFLLSICLLYTSPSPRDVRSSRMPSSA